MKYLFPVLSPFFIGWFLALIVYPIGEKLSRLTVSKKVHLTRERAGGVVILLFAGLAIFLLWEAMETCANRVPGWLSCLPDLKDEMNYFLANCCDHLEKITGILSEDSQGFVVKQMTAAEEAFLQGGGLESVSYTHLIISYKSLITERMGFHDIKSSNSKDSGGIESDHKN